MSAHQVFFNDLGKCKGLSYIRSVPKFLGHSPPHPACGGAEAGESRVKIFESGSRNLTYGFSGLLSGDNY